MNSFSRRARELWPTGSDRIGAMLRCAACVVFLTIHHSHAAELSSSPAPAGQSALLDAFGVQRSSESDILVFRDGTRRIGEVLSEVFEIRTVYGRMALPRLALAGIRFASGDSQFDSLLTVNQDRITGFVENPVIRAKLDSGAELEVRREKIERAVFRLRPADPAESRKGWRMLLQNGDVLNGKSATEMMTIRSQGSKTSVSTEDLVAIRFLDLTDGNAVFQKKDGEELNGTLENEDLEFELDLGSRVTIYRGYVKSILDREMFAAEGNSLVRAGERGASESLEVGKDGKSRGLVWIQPGEFLFGSSTEERDRGLDEGPQIEMKIPEGFWMGRCEVTQREYLEVMSVNPSHYSGDLSHPVEKVSWQEAVEYCNRRTANERKMGMLPLDFEYRLPTEAEWEYACRAGTVTRFSFGDDPEYARLGAFAWFNGNSSSSTQPVGLKQPNPWGLHDMHGNVWEWCLDHGPEGSSERRSSSLRGARGGSWLYEGRFCRSSNRDAYFPTNRCSDLGFRVVLARVPR